MKDKLTVEHRVKLSPEQLTDILGDFFATAHEGTAAAARVEIHGPSTVDDGPGRNCSISIPGYVLLTWKTT